VLLARTLIYLFALDHSHVLSYRVYDMRTQHPVEGFAYVQDKVIAVYTIAGRLVILPDVVC